MPGKDNTTKRKHYQSLLKQKKFLPESLTKGQNFVKAEEVIKADLEYSAPGVFKEVLDSFWEIRHTKSIEYPIDFKDILAYTQLMEVKLIPNEIRLLLTLDANFRDQYYKENK